MMYVTLHKTTSTEITYYVHTKEPGAGTLAAFTTKDELKAWFLHRHPCPDPLLHHIVDNTRSYYAQLNECCGEVTIHTIPFFRPTTQPVDAWVEDAARYLSSHPRLTFADTYDAERFCQSRPGYVQLTRSPCTVRFHPATIKARATRERNKAQALIDSASFPCYELVTFVGALEHALDTPFINFAGRSTYPRCGMYGRGRVTESEVITENERRIHDIHEWYSCHAPRFYRSRLQARATHLREALTPLLPYCRKHRTLDEGLTRNTCRALLSIKRQCRTHVPVGV